MKIAVIGGSGLIGTKLAGAQVVVDVAGPEPIALDKLAGEVMAANGDGRRAVADIHARYFGSVLNDQSLTPGQNPRIGPTKFENWRAGASASR